MIKRFVHQEKLSVYSRLEMYVKDFKYLIDSKDKEKLFLEKVDLIFGSKIQTHSKLAKEWKYNSDYSVRPYMIDTIVKTMQDIFYERIGGAYVAATLDANGYALSKDSYYKVPTDGSDCHIIKYTPEQKYWWCKCYYKYKTDSHAFYKEAKDYIEQYEIQ